MIGCRIGNFKENVHKGATVENVWIFQEVCSQSSDCLRKMGDDDGRGWCESVM